MEIVCNDFMVLLGLLLIQVPLYSSSVAQSAWRQDLSEEEVLIRAEAEDTWHWWNRFRWAADFNVKLRLVLELNEGDRPSIEVVQRWLGEPVEAVIIPSTMFIRNRHNFPVLPKIWQETLKLFVKAHVNIIVSTDCGDNSLKLYSDYLNNFREMNKDVHILQRYAWTLNNLQFVSVY